MNAATIHVPSLYPYPRHAGTHCRRFWSETVWLDAERASIWEYAAVKWSPRHRGEAKA